MDLEISRYENLSKCYPSMVFVKPGSNCLKSYTHYEILSTRYLYIKTYNSVPPENIWGLNLALNLGLNLNGLDKSATASLTIPTTPVSGSIEFLIGYTGLTELAAKSLKINKSDKTIRDVFEIVEFEQSSDTQYVCIGPSGIIDPKTKLNTIGYDKLNILVS
jgi:hypothetical protein